MFESLQPAAYALSFIFWVIGTTSTCSRIYSRGWIIKVFGMDDWWMAMVLVCNTVQQGLFCAFLHYGGGIHITSVTNEENILVLTKLLFVEEIMYIWMQFIIKTAFLLFYLRLVTNTNFTYTFWDSAAHPGAKCLSTTVTYYVPVALCIFMDFVILILPIRPLWKIQASVTRRLAIIATITVGGIAVLVSCLRVIVLHEFAVNPDFTYTLGKMVIISAIELNVAITAANVPSFKAIWRKHVTGTLTDQSNSSSHYMSPLGKGQSGGSKDRTIVLQRREPDYDHADLPDSSSTNNLVERQESHYSHDSK
ncbi:hypothetical protein N7493_007738 [Penicillium malachiteum]|uniref:Rhodopsin domain-containing protein n=1 Tax=Penicillium malachiteum TaxID=1324776 RepID=A0AAD6HIB1_9EURO|nr:hypothetical protein N7493_007738 [Penicillium malachiteum]